MKKFLLLFPLLALSLLAQKPATPGATLSITSEPAGATILLDREPRGTTPATLPVTPGVHLLTLQKPGFDDAFLTVNPLASAPTILNLRLEPQVAWILLHSEPQGAEITTDNISLGTTPALVKTLPPSSKTITFTLPGYQSKTIQLDIKDQTPILETVTLLSDSGTLKLTSEPAGARILVNGIPRGTTPATLERLDPDIKLELQLDGFITLNHSLRLNPGETQSLDLVLHPQPATLSVSSIPEKARIYLNNAFQGETPLNIPNLVPGTYRLRAEKQGHDPDARDVELARGAKQSVEFRLKSNLGRLEITTEPAGVTIFVDGQKVGETVADANQSTQISNPAPVENIATGTRELRLVRKGYRELREAVTIERGRTFTKHYTLERLFIPDYEVKTTAGILHRGVLDAKEPDFIRIETAPGIMKTIRTENIISQRYLRDDTQK